MVRAAPAPSPEPLCESMNDAPLTRATVPSDSAVNAPAALLPAKLNVALFRLRFAGLAPDISRPDTLVPVLSRVSVVPAYRVTSDVLRTWPTPLTVSVPVRTVVVPAWVSAPPITRLPAPVFVRPPVPLTAPRRVRVPWVLPKTASEVLRMTLPVQTLDW